MEWFNKNYENNCIMVYWEFRMSKLHVGMGSLKAKLSYFTLGRKKWYMEKVNMFHGTRKLKTALKKLKMLTSGMWKWCT